MSSEIGNKSVLLRLDMIYQKTRLSYKHDRDSQLPAVFFDLTKLQINKCEPVKN